MHLKFSLLLELFGLGRRGRVPGFLFGVFTSRGVIGFLGVDIVLGFFFLGMVPTFDRVLGTLGFSDLDVVSVPLMVVVFEVLVTLHLLTK